MRYILLLAFLSIQLQSFAQLFFNRFDSVQVTEENGLLAFPWAGGINHGQFSNIDFDMDGIQDLLVFDKSGDKVMCFRMNSNNEYELVPQYREMFVNQHNAYKDRLHDWVLLRDFNDDGKNDIFSYSNGGFAVYRNDGNADTLFFTLMTPKLESDYGNGLINVYVSPTDLPAIMDVDGDSDIDVVTFSLFGTAAEYHQNQSMELYGTADSLVMELATPCWGDFEEDPSTVAVNLDVTCKGGGYVPPTTQQAASSGPHSGFTMLGIDIEGDGDKDLVVSNVSFNTMNILENDGDATTAHIGDQDLTFPANYNSTDAIDLYTFPAAFLADVNNDGKEDMIATPYQENNGHDHQGCYLYTNSATTGYDFDFEKNNFLQDDMIELGTSAYPVFFDYDNDGLQDLIVGNRGYFQSTGVYSSQLAYYRNTGTVTEPAFELQTRDVANISALGLGNSIPTFGDLDGDGDEDMIVGDAAGAIHYFENSGGAGNPADFSLTEPGYQGIDIGGQFAAPCLFDVDGDDLLDLVIGERNGNLNFYQNTGTVDVPVFTAADSNWGGVDMRRNGLSFGFSTPFLFEHNGEIQMLVGSESGIVELYNEITEVISGPLELTATLGTGSDFSTSNETTPFGFSTKSGRNQYLIKAEELTAQGLQQGVFERIALTTDAESVTHAQFYIKMGMTNVSEMNGFIDGFSTSFYVATGTIPAGNAEFLAQTPLVWDGVSNLVVEFCWFQTNPGATPDINVQYSTLPYTCNAYASSGDFSACGIEYDGSNNERPNFIFAVKPSFNLENAFPAFEGERSSVALSDITNDGLPEMILGNLAGGLAYYKGDTVGLSINDIAELNRVERSELQIYPNPNNGTFTIAPIVPMPGMVELRVFNALGELVYIEKTTDLIQKTVRFSDLNSGIYFIDIRSENRIATGRFVIQR